MSESQGKSVLQRHRAHRSLRGQTSVFDFFTTVLVFVIVFTTFILLSDKSYRDMFFASSFSEVTSLGMSISEAFVSSSGVPSNWEANASAAQSIGFADHQNVLDPSKLAAFVTMDYNTSRQKIGLALFRSYTFAVIDMNNVTLYSSGTEKNEPRIVLPFTRYAILNGSTVRLRLVLYE